MSDMIKMKNNFPWKKRETQTWVQLISEANNGYHFEQFCKRFVFKFIYKVSVRFANPLSYICTNQRALREFDTPVCWECVLPWSFIKVQYISSWLV